MSVTDLERAKYAVEDARERLVGKLSDAVTPGIDLNALLDAIDDYIVARVALIKFDY